jgi:hypothetical protein
VEAYTVGSGTQVFYNPENPADAVLSPGFDGRDFVLVLLLTPFNCVIVALWLLSASWLRCAVLNPIAGGVTVRVEGHRICVRLPPFRPGAVALVVLGTLAFVGAFGLGSHPTFIVGAFVSCSIYAAAGLLYVWLLLRVHSGNYELIIDHGTQTVSLPKSFGRKEPLVISLSDILSVDTEAVQHVTFDSGLTVSYLPTIRLHGGRSKGLKLAEWYDRTKSERFVTWLRAEVKTPGAGG